LNAPRRYHIKISAEGILAFTGKVRGGVTILLPPPPPPCNKREEKEHNINTNVVCIRNKKYQNVK
jgi:hypothetical protein